MFFYLTLSLKGDKPICFLTWSFSVERVFFPREFKGETSFRNRFLRCRFDHKMLVKEGFRVQVSTFYVRNNCSPHSVVVFLWRCGFCGSMQSRSVHLIGFLSQSLIDGGHQRFSHFETFQVFQNVSSLSRPYLPKQTEP